VESWWACIKNLPAPAGNGKVLKQWYFNPHKTDSRVRGRWAGQCTAWVAYLWAQNYDIDMRRDLWMKWNAAAWWNRARQVGLTVSQTPIPGSIWRTSRSHGYYGHVVYVDEVYADEWLMLITDMNYRGAYQFTQRIEKINRMDWFIYPPS
jgi:surface antigen